jgi:hypothetical protein
MSGPLGSKQRKACCHLRPIFSLGCPVMPALKLMLSLQTLLNLFLQPFQDGQVKVITMISREKKIFVFCLLIS